MPGGRIYTPIGWVEDVTKVGPTNLNRMEQGIVDAYERGGFVGNAGGLLGPYFGAKNQVVQCQRGKVLMPSKWQSGVAGDLPYTGLTLQPPAGATYNNTEIALDPAQPAAGKYRADRVVAAWIGGSVQIAVVPGTPVTDAEVGTNGYYVGYPTEAQVDAYLTTNLVTPESPLRGWYEIGLIATSVNADYRVAHDHRAIARTHDFASVGEEETFSSLPSQPFRGQQILYASGDMLLANMGPWRLRYADGWWYPIGAAPLSSSLDSSATVPGTAYANGFATPPSVPLPLPGDYLIQHGAGLTLGAIGYVWASYTVGAAAAADVDAIQSAGDGSGQYIAASRAKKKTFAAAAVLAMQFRTGGGVGYLYNPWIVATPLRVK